MGQAPGIKDKPGDYPTAKSEQKNYRYDKDDCAHLFLSLMVTIMKVTSFRLECQRVKYNKSNQPFTRLNLTSNTESVKI